MDFSLSAKTSQYAAKLQAFMDSDVFPSETIYEKQRQELAAAGKPHGLPPVVEELKKKHARLVYGIYFCHITTTQNMVYL